MTNYNSISKIIQVESTIDKIEAMPEVLVEVPNNSISKEIEESVGIVNDCLDLNVRIKPSIDASILASIPCQSEVKIIQVESTDDFYKICTASGIQGFCMKKYINIKS